MVNFLETKRTFNSTNVFFSNAFNLSVNFFLCVWSCLYLLRESKSSRSYCHDFLMIRYHNCKDLFFTNGRKNLECSLQSEKQLNKYTKVFYTRVVWILRHIFSVDISYKEIRYTREYVCLLSVFFFYWKASVVCEISHDWR